MSKEDNRPTTGQVPRGIEVLVSKASVDPAFKAILLARRAQAADEIGLELDPSETMMLTGVPQPQLEAIIARTSVPQEHRRAFLGKAAAAMLAAVGLMSPGCIPVDHPAPTGERPDIPPTEEPPPEGDEELEPGDVSPETPPEAEPPDETEEVGRTPGEDVGPDLVDPSSGLPPEPPPVIRGIRPDVPLRTLGIRPDRIPMTKGIRPDVPPRD